MSLLAGLLGASARAALRLYGTGYGAGRWVAGHSSGAGTQTKNSDHLHLTAQDAGVAQRTWVTDAPVNLTGISAVEIDWVNVGDATSKAVLVASTSETASLSTFDAQLSKTGSFARTTEQMSVSTLTGLHYIRVHANDPDDAVSVLSEVRVYRVELIP